MKPRNGDVRAHATTLFNCCRSPFNALSTHMTFLSEHHEKNTADESKNAVLVYIVHISIAGG